MYYAMFTNLIPMVCCRRYTGVNKDLPPEGLCSSIRKRPVTLGILFVEAFRRGEFFCHLPLPLASCVTKKNRDNGFSLSYGYR